MPKYVLRYGLMRNLGIFSTRKEREFLRGHKVVARTERGLEVGEILCEATDDAVAQLEKPTFGEVIRKLSAGDENEYSHIQAQEGKEFETCQAYVKRLGLEMQLVDLEHVFGGERIVIYYLSDQRVDFRQLVRELAKEFQTRIEMRQIGVRDEAKLLADYGDCGKPVCCNTHLSVMPPVSMRMAKLQKATLDPTKISGRCGRLKCCLRYEYPTYEELESELPPVGASLITKIGKATVLGREILASQLLIETEDHRRVLLDFSDVIQVLEKPSPNRVRSKPDDSDLDSVDDIAPPAGRTNRRNRDADAYEGDTDPLEGEIDV